MPRPIDLDQLSRQHADERSARRERSLLQTPRPMSVRIPAELPESEAALTRLRVAGVETEASFVIDHLRSLGPWLASLDETPQVLFDASGRWCSNWGGFGLGGLIRADIEGHFAHATATSRIAPDPIAIKATARLEQRLRDALQLGSDAVITFAPTGREAIELAIRGLQEEGAPPPLTFADARFDFGVHAPLPAWRPPVGDPPDAPGPDEMLQRVLEVRPQPPERDLLLTTELISLKRVHEALSSGECSGCILEPIQRRAGDHYVTLRFMRALQALVHHHGAWLIYDETEVGFGAAGHLSWTHHLLGHTPPDALVLHDPGGVGFCVGRLDLSHVEPPEVEAALLLRTSIRLNAGLDHSEPTETQRRLQKRLTDLVEHHPTLTLNPRVRGATLTFTLPDPALRNALAEAMRGRGLMVDRTGQGTLSLHLPLMLDRGTTTRVFQHLEQALRRLAAPEEVADPAPAARRRVNLEPQAEVRIRACGPEEADAMVEAVMELERQIFEPARRDPAEKLRIAFDDPYGSALIAELEQPDGSWAVVGYALGYPLESRFSRHLGGPDRDVMLDRDNTLYSAAISISSAVRGRGLGRSLKIEQLRHARSMSLPDGSPRYRYVTGRNRVGMTRAMTRINHALGAHDLCVLTHQYGDPDGKALYYRIPLRGPAPDPELISAHHEPPNLSAGLRAPLRDVPAELRELHAGGWLHGPLIHGLEPTRDPTLDAIQAIEWLSALTPEHPGLALAPSRDAALTTALTILRHHRPDASVALGVEGGYLGHTTREAQALSDPAVLLGASAPPAGPLLPHPNDAEAFRGAVARWMDGRDPASALGIVVEAVQERTGRPLTAEGEEALREVRAAYGVPLVVVETATAHYRSGRGPFASLGWSVTPDLIAWWGGGQLGVVHTTDAYRPPSPHDMGRARGGELALLRVHHQLLTAREIDLAPAIAALDDVLRGAARLGMEARGEGLYRVLDAGARSGALLAALEELEVAHQTLPGGGLVIAPPLDDAVGVIAQLGEAFEAVERGTNG